VRVAAELRNQRFEALFREHYPAVRAYALRRSAPDSAQDAVAETFLVAWRRLDSVPEDPLPWLYGVARRVLANQRRSDNRRRALGERLAAERAPGGADPAERLAEVDAVAGALARLRPDDREALMLSAWEGLDNAGAARASGCSRAAFAVRLHRARGRLAQALDAYEREPVAAAADTQDLDSMEAR
jgi:RNA polymerase sigma factor (sigma-70 family)